MNGPTSSLGDEPARSLQTGLLQQQNRLVAQQMEQPQWTSSGAAQVGSPPPAATRESVPYVVSGLYLANVGRSAITCATCQTRLEMPAFQTSYVCPPCGARNYVRLCPSCSKVVHIPQSLAGTNVDCAACGVTKSWAEAAGAGLSEARKHSRAVKRVDADAAQNAASARVRPERIADKAPAG
jgi:predicted RNA-binding Zn-ribbon protein involved in translation (DUF1610 family)